MIIRDCLILKGIGGFYYVKAPDGKVYECNARGVFRKDGKTPLAGDNVSLDVNDRSSTVYEIYDRKNYLLRPPVANIDKLIIVSSVLDPAPNLYVLDKLTAIACDKDIQPFLVFSKADLAPSDEYIDIYLKSGIECFSTSIKTGEGIDRLREIFSGSVCALTGNSGVGKSSILNMIEPTLNLKTSVTSKKFGRGKHTTRSVELIEICGGYIADTPGFTSLDFENTEVIKKENLQFCFPEFEKYIGKCRFADCSHTNDKGCAVLSGVSDGSISKSRHESYCRMYEEASTFKEWELKNI